MTDLIVVSLERWDEIWRRNQHLVSGLLAADRDLRVLFVEPPADPLHDIASGRAPARGRRAGAAAPGAPRGLSIYRPVKWLPRRVDRRADERLARGILRAAARLGFAAPLLWLNDPSGDAVARLSTWPTLYDITDDWAAADRTPAEHARIVAGEAALLEGAAEVVACSAELVRRKSSQRPPSRHPIVLIPNAVDAAAYRTPAPRPRDLPEGPIVLYAGTLHGDRLDIALAERTARELGPAASLVLVGPNALPEADSERLRRAGALLLGPRPRTLVPAYLQHADVLIVPHSVTPFTDSLDPIKLYEYQAAGRPVVSTPVSGFRDAADPRVRIADGADFTEAIRAALGGSPEVSREDARTVADWSDRVAAMGEVLARMLREAGGSATAGGVSSSV